jgi:two-component system OmpR family sensor kinase
LFRPFFRGSNAGGSGGQGLGLAVVARIAAAHGGEAGLRNVEDGGLEVSLRMPLAQPDHG